MNHLHTAGDDVKTLLERVLPSYQRALRDAISDAEGPDRLTMPQLRCLQAIANAGETPATTGSLAELTRVTAPTMSSMLDGLVSRGLVERRPDPQSRRRVHLYTTEQGNAVLMRYGEIADAFHRALLASLDDDDRVRLEKGLRALESGLQQLGGN
jgi:DNA-binding MarR family transcriptional regulator